VPHQSGGGGVVLHQFNVGLKSLSGVVSRAPPIRGWWSRAPPIYRGLKKSKGSGGFVLYQSGSGGVVPHQFQRGLKKSKASGGVVLHQFLYTFQVRVFKKCKGGRWNTLALHLKSSRR